MFYSRDKSIFRKNLVLLPIEKFSSLVLLRNAIRLQQLIIKFSLYHMSSGQLWEVKNRLLALKVVLVAYQRQLLTRGSKCSDLTWKILVFWKAGCWGEVVETGGLTVWLTNNDNHCLNLTQQFLPQHNSPPTKKVYYNIFHVRQK